MVVAVAAAVAAGAAITTAGIMVVVTTMPVIMAVVVAAQAQPALRLLPARPVPLAPVQVRQSMPVAGQLMMPR
jgi:hypothetical protein